ncbi:Ger(x)C family spore germination protein [Cohnella faecalis]|uniref:Ger(X)C family spore germination protein n=2 Tax=Cohnella faecalis TaxID=2315694 RepID=A0A398CJX7_9BACL|nr:Ger(x)C family spore germination protein [Cohnella faecalis]
MALCFALTGCWDRTELNELAITAGTAIDWKEGRWVVTYQVVIPSAISAVLTAVGGGAGKVPVIVYSTEGETIREAVAKSALESPRKLFFSHNRVVVISSAAALHGLENLLDIYLRNPDTRETVSTLISDKDARTILEQLMQVQIIPSDGIEETVKGEAEQLSTLPHVRMYNLAMSLAGPAHSAALPEILVSGDQGVTSADDLSQTSLKSKLRLGRLGLLRDNRMVGWLSRSEALGVAFISNKVSETSIIFSCEGDGAKPNSTFQIEHSKTKLRPEWKNGELVMHININSSGTLVETGCSVEDLNNPATIKQMEKQLRLQVLEQVETSWEATKKLKTDVLGFADIIRRKYPKRWKEVKTDWPNQFSKIRIDPIVSVRIARMGLSSKPYKTLLEKDGNR